MLKLSPGIKISISYYVHSTYVLQTMEIQTMKLNPQNSSLQQP